MPRDSLVSPSVAHHEGFRGDAARRHACCSNQDPAEDTVTARVKGRGAERWVCLFILTVLAGQSLKCESLPDSQAWLVIYRYSSSWMYSTLFLQTQDFSNMNTLTCPIAVHGTKTKMGCFG